MPDKNKKSGNNGSGREKMPMSNKQQDFLSQKVAMAKLIWMEYFNRTAYEHGLITEQERNQLKIKIDRRYGRSAPVV